MTERYWDSERGRWIYPGTLGDYMTPDWAAATKVHDWRNYINDEVRSLWITFHADQCHALAKNAQEIADREEWD